jgi:hypothetical protein
VTGEGLDRCPTHRSRGTLRQQASLAVSVPLKLNISFFGAPFMLIRYLTREKFEWLLCDNGIYIGSASAQDDQNEGLYESKKISEVLKATNAFNVDWDWKKLDDTNQSLMLNSRANNYLSSWFCGDNETQEMWNQYGDDGVALISDEISLIGALPDPVGNAASFYKVIYNNFKKAGAIHNHFQFTEERFQYESEFRLVVDMPRYSILTGFEKEKFGVVYVGNIPSYEDEGTTCCISPQGKLHSHCVIKNKGAGYVISFDLDSLIKEIRLHPNCAAQSARHINALLNMTGRNISVKRSSLECQQA